MEKPSDKLIEKLAGIQGLRIESDSKVEIDFTGFEQKQKELQIEVTMRRRQLKETREELDASRVKNQELQYSVDAAKRCAQEYERNMNIAMERNKQLERNLHETADAKSKALRECDILKSENKLLKDAVTQCETEKYNLLRVNDELKSRNICNDFYRNEIGNQQTKFNALMTKTRETFKNLEAQHKELMAQQRDIESCKNVLSSMNIIEDRMNSISGENKALECELIKLKAKQAQLELSLKSDLDLQTKEEQFFFKEWKHCFCKFQQYVKTHDKITYNLMEQLKTEKDANTKLILMLAKMKTEEGYLKTMHAQVTEQQSENEEHLMDEHRNNETKFN